MMIFHFLILRILFFHINSVTNTFNLRKQPTSTVVPPSNPLIQESRPKANSVITTSNSNNYGLCKFCNCKSFLKSSFTNKCGRCFHEHEINDVSSTDDEFLTESLPKPLKTSLKSNNSNFSTPTSNVYTPEQKPNPTMPKVPTQTLLSTMENIKNKKIDTPTNLNDRKISTDVDKNELNKKLDEKEKKITELNNSVKEKNEIINKLTNQISELTTNKLNLESKIEDLEKQINNFKQLTPSSVNTKEIEDVKKQLEEEYKKKENLLNETQQQKEDKFNNEKKQYLQEIDKLKKDILEIKNENEQIKILNTNTKSISNEYENIKQQYKDVFKIIIFRNVKKMMIYLNNYKMYNKLII